MNLLKKTQYVIYTYTSMCEDPLDIVSLAFRLRGRELAMSLEGIWENNPI